MATTLNLTKTITNITPAGNNVWRIEFNPADTLLTTQNVTNNIIFYSTSANPVIMDPFLNNLGNWNTDEYNATINNVQVERENKWLSDVDYSTNQAVPINFEAIISGSATRATIPESNYTSQWWSGIRYEGSKNSSDGFNRGTTLTVNAIQAQQNIELGATTLGEAAASDGTSVGLYYYWAGGADPEVPGTTAFQIKFMFDENGNVFTPNISSSYYYDLLYGFQKDSLANVIPYNKDGSTKAQNSAQASIQGLNSVFWPGVYFSAYLTSQSGSTVNDDFNSAQLKIENQLQTIQQTYTSSPSFAYWFTTASGVSLDKLYINGTISGIMYNNAGAYTNEIGVFPAFGKEGLYYQTTGSYVPQTRAGFDNTTIPILPSPYEMVYNLSPPDLYFSGAFSPFPDLVRISSNSDANYIYRTVKYAEISGSGTGILNLNETIPSTGYAASSGRINEITLLRLVPAPEKLYLNVTKASGDSGPGFILPNNPSQKLRENFPNIIADLSSKNLI